MLLLALLVLLFIFDFNHYFIIPFHIDRLIVFRKRSSLYIIYIQLGWIIFFHIVIITVYLKFVLYNMNSVYNEPKFCLGDNKPMGVNEFIKL